MNIATAQHCPTTDRPRAAPAGRAAVRGFSFIEIVVVMGAMAVLLGLAVGYIGNIGKSTFVAQAKAMLSETAHACTSASVGGRRAVLTLREVDTEDGDTVLMIGASIARPVLTHQFETLDFASEARAPAISGKVELDRKQGRVGNCAKFSGGYLEFAASSVFAMTEGLELDVWIKPESHKTLMSLVRGGEAYEVQLTQAGGSDTYDVRLRLKLRKASESVRTIALDQTYETKGGPVIADGRWQRIQVMWQGLEPSIRVNGLECYSAGGKARQPGGAMGADVVAQVHKIVVGPRGAIPLTISAPGSPYSGLMDGFRILGVFQSEDLERILPGELEVLFPTVPLRIAFFNGGLDPDLHSGDQIIRIRDARNPADPAMRLTVGMYGTISSELEQPGTGGPESAKPGDSTGKKRSSSDDGAKEAD